ncbi:MAG: hypothetical protein FIA99_01835 [Ruminiclostridium sp.]|nr:hypothetical protein [Ruminiclostridium sp.]
MNKVVNKIKSENGFSLVITILVMAVLTILSVILLSLSLSETTLAAHQSNKKQAYYLARSGAETVATYIIKNANKDIDLFDRTSNMNSSLSNGEFNVQVEGLATGPSVYNILVRGTATVNNVQNTAAVLLYRKTLQEIGYNAIYSGEALNINNMKVIGDVQSGGTIEYRTSGSNAYDDTAVPNSPLYIELPEFPNPPAYTDEGGNTVTNLIVQNQDTVTITQSCRLDSITIDQQGKIIIEAAAGEIIDIVVNTITINNILEINAGDGGGVRLFVNTLMNIQTQGLINNTYPKQLHIYLADGSVFDMQANIILNGYITGPHADVIIQSDQSTVNGYIIANSVTKNGPGTGGANGAVNFIPENDPEEIPEYMKAYKMVEWTD